MRLKRLPEQHLVRHEELEEALKNKKPLPKSEVRAPNGAMFRDEHVDRLGLSYAVRDRRPGHVVSILDLCLTQKTAMPRVEPGGGHSTMVARARRAQKARAKARRARAKAKTKASRIPARPMASQPKAKANTKGRAGNRKAKEKVEKTNPVARKRVAKATSEAAEKCDERRN